MPIRGLTQGVCFERVKKSRALPQIETGGSAVYRAATTLTAFREKKLRQTKKIFLKILSHSSFRRAYLFAVCNKNFDS